MGTLAGPELASQRINVAYTTKDQNDEHSCFSDSTNADLANDVLGHPEPLSRALRAPRRLGR